MPVVTTSLVTDTDLQEFMPDVLSFGVASFDQQTIRATDDVLARLEAEWWPDVVSRKKGLDSGDVSASFRNLPVLDVALLDTDVIKPLICYRALSRYIMPMLGTDADSDGDLFSRRAFRYDTFYDDEWQKVIQLPLYDFDADASFEAGERKGSVVRRLVRG